MEQATQAVPGGPTVAEYVETWLRTHCAPPFRAAYIQRSRRASMRNYVLPYVGERRLAAVDGPALAKLQRDLFARGLAQATVRTAIGHFAELWKAARLDGLVRGRPYVDLVWPRQRQTKPDVFTAAERDQVVRLVFEAKVWFAPQVGLMFLAGLRPSEAAGVQIHNVDLETGRLEIEQAIVQHERTNGKTRKSLRAIILPRQLVRLLAGFLDWQGRTKGYLSANRNGSPVHTAVFTVPWKATLKAAGVRYRKPYAMRATSITLMLMSGAAAAPVAEYHGTSVQEIERSYLSWIGAVRNPMDAQHVPTVRGLRHLRQLPQGALQGAER